jgi:hypothetical protein
MLMKKLLFILPALAFVLAFTACADEPVIPCTPEATTTIEIAEPSPFVWIDSGWTDGRRVFDEDGHWLGIVYHEQDLTQPHFGGRRWSEIGLTIEPHSELSAFLRPIATRDEAAYIGERILETTGQLIGGLTLELRQVTWDAQQNIWMFGYSVNPIIRSNGMGAAIDGNTGEILRMWID